MEIKADKLRMLLIWKETSLVPFAKSQEIFSAFSLVWIKIFYTLANERKDK